MEILRDKNGKVIGSIRGTDPQKLFNAAGKMCGTYSKGSNTTYDQNGAVVAKCNLLVSLLKN